MIRWVSVLFCLGLLALALAACGSSSNGDRTKLSAQISSQLAASGVPADLASCVSQQAKGLPIDQLRSLANAGSNASGSVKQQAVHLVTTCVSQGKGLAGLHQQIVAGIVNRAATTNLPPVFTSCLEARANQTTPAQLSQLTALYASGNTTLGHAEAQKLGAQLAVQCLHQNDVLNALRGKFVAPFEASLSKSKFSAAFKGCLLTKAKTISTSKLEQMALHPTQAFALGQTFGRNAARACIASGAKP